VCKYGAKYINPEKGRAKGIKKKRISSVKAEDIFLYTKLWLVIRAMR
jgi:diketogulonate reductase-like aldo/keto reductase